jgi:hypothetical protein
MNNQMPYGFFPPFNFEQNEIKQINDRLNNLEKKVNKLEKKIEIMEGNNVNKNPNYNMPGFPNNYMM